MVPFGGWDMPVEYSGLISEHMAVRKAAGLFDVSHMGEFEVEGPGALAFLQRVTANDVAKLVDGQAQYSALPMPNGAPVDDVDRLPPRGRPLPPRRERRQHREGLPLAARAGPAGLRAQEPQRRLRARSRCRARARRRSCSRSPPLDLAGLKYYHFADGEVDGLPGHRLAHRLHGRGRVRDLRRRPRTRRPSGSGCSSRAREGPRARRPRRARHPAPRGAHVPLRQRHGRDDHAGRGRPRLDRVPRRGQGRLPGPRRAGGAEEERRRRASWSASR